MYDSPEERPVEAVAPWTAWALEILGDGEEDPAGDSALTAGAGGDVGVDDAVVAADVDMTAVGAGEMAGKDAEAPSVEASGAAAAEADGPEGASLGTVPVAVAAVAEVVAEAAHVAVMVPVVALALAAGTGTKCQGGLSKAPSSDCKAREWSKTMLQGSTGEQKPVGGDGIVASG